MDTNSLVAGLTIRAVVPGIEPQNYTLLTNFDPSTPDATITLYFITGLELRIQDGLGAIDLWEKMP